MTTSGPILCISCRHLNRADAIGPFNQSVCTAFPEGIPFDINPGGADHRTTRGDEVDGIVFELPPADDTFRHQAEQLYDYWLDVHGQ